MRSTKWLAFGLSNKQTKTLVHFFPSAGSITAPYPVNCKLSIFGHWEGKKSLTIEGARLSQADGIRVEEVFPDYLGGAESHQGIYGLEIELSVFQPGIDISASSCIVEMQSRASTASYRAAPLSQSNSSATLEEKKSRKASEESSIDDEKEELSIANFLSVHDAYQTTSLIMLNSGNEKFIPGFFEQSAKHDEEILSPLRHSFELAPVSLLEHRLKIEDFSEVEPVECSFGLFRAKQMYVKQFAANDSRIYALYRDKVSDQPISVSAI